MTITRLILPIAAATVSVCFADITIPEGTKVRVRLEQNLSSATAEEGQQVQFTVTEDVRVDGQVAISQGASAVGTIVQAVPKRRMGRTGKLDFSIERVIAADSDQVPLRYTPVKKEGGSHAARTGALTAGAAVVFWPAAPVFLLMKGKDVTVNRGVTIDVFTDSNHALKSKPAPAVVASAAAPQANPAGAPQPAMASAMLPAPAQNATVKFISDPDGAEIELDGAFVGSTPTTLPITAGMHNVTVKRGAQEWRRSIQIQPGSSITLNAVLAKR